MRVAFGPVTLPVDLELGMKSPSMSRMALSEQTSLRCETGNPE
jgi:hypothetical protein